MSRENDPTFLRRKDAERAFDGVRAAEDLRNSEALYPHIPGSHANGLDSVVCKVAEVNVVEESTDVFVRRYLVQLFTVSYDYAGREVFVPVEPGDDVQLYPAFPFDPDVELNTSDPPYHGLIVAHDEYGRAVVGITQSVGGGAVTLGNTETPTTGTTDDMDVTKVKVVNPFLEARSPEDADSEDPSTIEFMGVYVGDGELHGPIDGTPELRRRAYFKEEDFVVRQPQIGVEQSDAVGIELNFNDGDGYPKNPNIRTFTALACASIPFPWLHAELTEDGKVKLTLSDVATDPTNDVEIKLQLRDTSIKLVAKDPQTYSECFAAPPTCCDDDECPDCEDCTTSQVPRVEEGVTEVEMSFVNAAAAFPEDPGDFSGHRAFLFCGQAGCEYTFTLSGYTVDPNFGTCAGGDESSFTLSVYRWTGEGCPTYATVTDLVDEDEDDALCNGEGVATTFRNMEVVVPPEEEDCVKYLVVVELADWNPTQDFGDPITLGFDLTVTKDCEV